jgi:hypothetical protein
MRKSPNAFAGSYLYSLYRPGIHPLARIAGRRKEKVVVEYGSEFVVAGDRKKRLQTSNIRHLVFAVLRRSIMLCSGNNRTAVSASSSRSIIIHIAP